MTCIHQIIAYTYIDFYLSKKVLQNNFKARILRNLVRTKSKQDIAHITFDVKD